MGWGAGWVWPGPASVDGCGADRCLAARGEGDHFGGLRDASSWRDADSAGLIVDSSPEKAGKADVYARVSTSEQNLELQLREIQDYASRQDWEIVETPPAARRRAVQGSITSWRVPGQGSSLACWFGN